MQHESSNREKSCDQVKSALVFCFFFRGSCIIRGGVNQVVINLFRQAQESGNWHPLICVNLWKFPAPEYSDVGTRPTVYVRLRSPWNSRWAALGLLVFLVRLPSALCWRGTRDYH